MQNDFLDVKSVCAFFGGTRPIHPATLYRGIAAGRYPRPVHVSPNIARWVYSECLAARKRLMDERDRQPARAGRRGQPSADGNV
jgi:predicted DNA-binding transcriptional regulator AlpA